MEGTAHAPQGSSFQLELHAPPVDARGDGSSIGLDGFNYQRSGLSTFTCAPFGPAHAIPSLYQQLDILGRTDTFGQIRVDPKKGYYLDMVN